MASDSDTDVLVPERKYCQVSTPKTLLVVGGEYAIIVSVVYMTWQMTSWWLYAVAVVIIGTRQYALGEAMAHEASHRHLSSSQRLNEFLGILVTWPFFYSLSGYRRFHDAHHNNTINDAHNSINEEYEDWKLPTGDEKLSKAKAYWFFLGRPIVGVISFYHVNKTIQDFYYDGDLWETRFMLAFWGVLFGLIWYFGFWFQLVMCWIVPQVTVFAVIIYWSEVSDHYRVTGGSTRTDTNWIFNKLVSHNIGYHGLHHQMPGIPWHRLPQAYDFYSKNLNEQVSTGFWATFNQIADFSPMSVKRCQKADLLV